MNTQDGLFDHVAGTVRLADEQCQAQEEKRAAQTFDEISELYDKNPLAFVENLLGGHRYEFPVGDECCTCASWDKITGAAPRHIMGKNHDRDGQAPRPHKFEPDIGWHLVQHLSEPQLRKVIAKYRRRGDRGNEAAEEHADLLNLYRRLKF
jgi:hypothetical protein